MRARELRANPTEAERALWAHLSARKVAGARFNRQKPIGPFICDFVSRSAKLIVEVDGGQHADSRRDKMRDAHLRAEGFQIARYWNNDVLKNPEGVLTDLLMRLRRE